LEQLAEQQPASGSQRNLVSPVYRVRPVVRAIQRPARRLCLAVARGGAYGFGGGNGSRAGSGLILARIAFKIWMRCDMK